MNFAVIIVAGGAGKRFGSKEPKQFLLLNNKKMFEWSIIAFKKVKQFISPFIVCPRCGHTFADKRTAMGLIRAFQPWKWF